MKLKNGEKKKVAYCLAAVGLGLFANSTVLNAAPATVYESRVDHYRTGANLNETILNTSNVNPGSFGLLFNLPIKGGIVTQTLYAPGVTINNVVHNVIYVTSLAGIVYAYDADVAGAPLWIKDLSGIIQSTPVIDPTTKTIYVVSQDTNSPYQFSLHALDIATSAEKFGGPQLISGTFTAAGNTIDILSSQLQSHAGLALVKGHIIIALTVSVNCL